MKKFVFTAIFIVFLAAGLPVFAQDQRDERDSEFYYINVSLEKVYPYRKGYIVQYRKGFFEHGKAYLPAEWFTDADSKGEIITLPRGKSWPSMTVYFRNGEFSHVRLYVHHVATHWTWGIVPQDVDLDDRFDYIDKVTIDFK